MYFKREHFRTAVPLSTTAMLVMYTLQASISAQLPTTSYIKYIDIWLLNGALMPFIILIIKVFNEYQIQTSEVN